MCEPVPDTYGFVFLRVPFSLWFKQKVRYFEPYPTTGVTRFSPSKVAIDWWCPLKLSIEVPKRDMEETLH